MNKRKHDDLGAKEPSNAMDTKPDDDASAVGDEEKVAEKEASESKDAAEDGAEGEEEKKDVPPEEMLVYQLKEELKRRGFSATGRKPALVQKLKDAIAGKIQPDAKEEAPKKKRAPRKKKEEEEESEDKREEEEGDSSSAKAEDGEKEDGEDESPKKKRARRTKKEAGAEKEKKKAAPKSKKGGKELVWSPNPDAPVPPITEDDSKYLKIISWNLNGLKAVLEKNYMKKYVDLEKPDVICFQETKWQASTPYPNDMLGEGWTAYWNCCVTTKGYAGTAVFTKVNPINVTYGIGIKEHDEEGRAITLEFDKFFLVNTYIPNSGQKLERLEYRTQSWDKDFLAYLKKLEASKPVVWCGDLNVAHQEIDLANPKGNKKTAGFTDQERKGFSALLASGFVDTFRHQNPDKQQFTYWSYRFSAREKNIGWRLDYFVVSEKFVPEIGPSFVRPDVLGSDHCPIGLLVKKD